MRRCVRCLVGTLAALCVVVLAACSTSTPTVEVRLFTGLVPGAEFRYVQTTVQTSDRHSIESAESVANLQSDYASGARVASFSLVSGSYLVHVQLLRADGTLLVENTVALTVIGDSVLPVHITRDCVAVSCPSAGGSPDLLACLHGQCVDPRCSARAPEFCPAIDFCDDASDCSATAPCAANACVDGVCIAHSLPGMCDAESFCVPDVGAGCMPLAGPIDPATGIRCGTICTSSATPCRFGYWSCREGAEPACEDLQARPSATVCAVDSVCDSMGECVAATTVPAIHVTPTTGLITTESGATAEFTVALTTEPSAFVFVLLSTDDATEGSVAPVTLIFSPENWGTAQTVTVTGVDDSVMDGDQPYTVALMPATSTDSDYAGIDPTDVSVVNHDDDTAGLTFSRTTGLATTESGGTDTFEVSPRRLPLGDVTLTFASSDTSEGSVVPASVTFTASNWETPRTITVTGANDDAADGDIAYHVTVHTSSAGDPQYDALEDVDVGCVNADNDTPGVSVSPTSGLITDERGGTDSFTVVLDTRPSASVTIPISSGNAGEGTPSPTSLTFTTSDWSTPQTVTVTGVDDATLDADRVFSVLLAPCTSTDSAYAGIDPDDVSVTNRNTTCASGELDCGGACVTCPSNSDIATVGCMGSMCVATSCRYNHTLGVGDCSGLPPALTLVPSNYEMDDGPHAMALSADGNTIALGAFGESSNATGIDGNQADNSAFQSGAVYIFHYNGSGWSQQAYIKASNTGAGDLFGFVVALSDDGSRLAVGAPAEASSGRGVGATQGDDARPYSGAVYVFTRTGSTWSQDAYLKTSNSDVLDQFGYGLAFSGDGNVLAATAVGEGSNATGVNGNQADNSVDHAGAVYVFRRSGTWVQEAYLKSSMPRMNMSFGDRALDLSTDGNTLVVGAAAESDLAATYFGTAYVFRNTAGTWALEQQLFASNPLNGGYFGLPVELSGDGNTLVVAAASESSGAVGFDGDEFDMSSPGSGAVYLFSRSGSTWTQTNYLKASVNTPYSNFGRSLTLSEDGRTFYTMHRLTIERFERPLATWTHVTNYVHDAPDTPWKIEISADSSRIVHLLYPDGPLQVWDF